MLNLEYQNVRCRGIWKPDSPSRRADLITRIQSSSLWLKKIFKYLILNRTAPSWKSLTGLANWLAWKPDCKSLRKGRRCDSRLSNISSKYFKQNHFTPSFLAVLFPSAHLRTSSAYHHRIEHMSIHAAYTLFSQIAPMIQTGYLQLSSLVTFSKPCKCWEAANYQFMQLRNLKLKIQRSFLLSTWQVRYEYIDI